jgi:hypothetical protein
MIILQALLVAIGISMGLTSDPENIGARGLDKIHWGLATLLAIAASVANAQRHGEPNYEVVNSYSPPSFSDYTIEFLKAIPFILAGAIVGFGIKFLWHKLHAEANNKDQQDKKKRNVSDTRQSPAAGIDPQVDRIRPATFTEGGIEVARNPDGTYSSKAKPPSAPPQNR